MGIHLPHRRIGTGKTPKELEELVRKYERELDYGMNTEFDTLTLQRSVDSII